jgi:dihydroxyacetone kinase-like predicted kinase
VEDHPSSAVRDCLFNLFAATLHIAGRSSIRKLRTRHAVVTGTNQHGTKAHKKANPPPHRCKTKNTRRRIVFTVNEERIFETLGQRRASEFHIQTAAQRSPSTADLSHLNPAIAGSCRAQNKIFLPSPNKSNPLLPNPIPLHYVYLKYEVTLTL